jgi:hypothetical protein
MDRKSFVVTEIVGPAWPQKFRRGVSDDNFHDDRGCTTPVIDNTDVTITGDMATPRRHWLSITGF